MELKINNSQTLETLKTNSRKLEQSSNFFVRNFENEKVRAQSLSRETNNVTTKSFPVQFNSNSSVIATGVDVEREQKTYTYDEVMKFLKVDSKAMTVDEKDDWLFENGVWNSINNFSEEEIYNVHNELGNQSIAEANEKARVFQDKMKALGLDGQLDSWQFSKNPDYAVYNVRGLNGGPNTVVMEMGNGKYLMQETTLDEDVVFSKLNSFMAENFTYGENYDEDMIMNLLNDFMKYL